MRPPGHHASADSSWGFCYFNNMAVALDHLRRHGHIQTAYVLDFDLHYGDGTVNILKPKGYAAIHNPMAEHRAVYLKEVVRIWPTPAPTSSGFLPDSTITHGLGTGTAHRGLPRDRVMVRETCRRLGIGCFAVLEGGYNHQVLGEAVRAFLRGLQGRLRLKAALVVMVSEGRLRWRD